MANTDKNLFKVERKKEFYDNTIDANHWTTPIKVEF